MDGPTWIYITGVGRSGSTLLGVLAAEATGGVNCGEVVHLWACRAAGEPCQCGADVDRCPVWSAIIEDVRRELGPQFDQAEARMRRLSTRWPRWTTAFRRPLDQDVAIRHLTERVIERHVDASVIIDASKFPPALGAAASRQRPLVVIHLVRDPRGVAYSWSRRKVIGRSTVLPVRGVWGLARRWVFTNLCIEYALWRMRRRTPWVRSVRITYEELVADPVKALAELVALTGDNRTGRAERWKHGVAGNNALFKPAPIQLDRGWENGMSRLKKLSTVLLTAPLLVRYGYALHSPDVDRPDRRRTHA